MPRSPTLSDADAAYDPTVTSVADLPLLELASDSGESFPVDDPATGETIRHVPRMGSAETLRALRTAEDALPAWRGLLAKERARIMRRWSDLMLEHAEALARLLTTEQGKPLAESRVEIEYAASFLEWFGEEAKRVYGDTIPTYMHDRRIVVTKEPVGVTAGITPWNFPAAMVTRKAAPALAAGCTMLLKPAEQTPLSALLFAEACRDAGLPDGVVNVVPGMGPTAGRAIVEHPNVAMISFTGSTDVGREIGSEAGRRLKPVVLELGGKAPNIVFADAQLDQAATTALYMVAYNQGQVCSAGTRLLVERSIHDEFIDRVVTHARTARVGDPLDPDTQIGAVISPVQLQRIQDYVEVGRQEGAELVAGGSTMSVPGHDEGWFYQPTIFRGVESRMRIAQEEIFGPVLSVLPFENEEEAVRIANDVMYGLSAAIWTRDVSRAHRLAERIEAGIVFVNTMNDGRGLGSPFGGWKQSGIGLENGLEGLLACTRLKTVILNLDAPTPTL